MPKISVIIPTYNLAHYLPEAIESVLRQTYKDLEIIIIDDGSTDNTKEVVTPYLERAIFLATENKGPSAARNRAIRESSGDFLAFLDADDIWHPDKLERQLAYLSENPDYHLVFSDSIERRLNSSEKDILFFSRKNLPRSGWVFSEMLRQNFILPTSVMVKKNCLEKAGLFDEKIRCWEGYDLWLRIAFRYQIGYINAPLITRRLRKNSTFSSSRLNEINGLIRIFEKWDNCSHKLSEMDKKNVNECLRLNYRRLGSYYLINGCRDESRRALIKSIARGGATECIAYFGLSLLPKLVIRTLHWARNQSKFLRFGLFTHK